MHIFQKSVIRKHLKGLDKSQIQNSFEKFKEVYSFGKIQNIKSLKEEEYQEGFLITGNNLKDLSILLNSRLMFFCFKKFYAGGGLGDKGIRYKKEFLIKLPIPKIPQAQQQPFIAKADTMLYLNKQLQAKKQTLLTRLKDNLSIQKITKKLESFYDHDFKTFILELKKQKIDLSLKQQDEWSEYFNDYKTKINELQNQIQTTDSEIDEMVYKLYDLTEEEIAVVKGSYKDNEN